ncbi:AraC family transcriptional regulator [Bradyrhizobium sp. CCBAU 51627]|uniref:AraC family transcriptional regulator n=1 Tax=Bradyrhizobium sp. CCBAU 51627 TaxID=1325088 RepID=UPI0023053484|nr:AraC family transcriptional regulator [Bradyrhizobium sp. CCBAU 51627]MDA9434388.1 hypothetical protein [Bradyrhizobium sp. CCBAU 51627]
MSSTLRGRGADVLQELRARTMGVSEIVPLTSDGDFEISARSIWLPIESGGVLLTDSAVTGVRYERTAAHVASGALDVYQIAECVEGEMEVSTGRHEWIVRSGDLFLIDMAQPSRTILVESANRRCAMHVLVLPRSVLAPRLAHPDSATGPLYRSNRDAASPLARLYSKLWRRVHNDEGSAAGLIDHLADLVAKAVGSAEDTQGNVARADRQLFLAMAKRYIETHLEAEPLTAETLCDRLGISRASLYRMFQRDGGLAGYVQDRRLNYAMRRLIGPEGQKIRLLDLAINLRFSSDSTFTRAFRRKFGLTPSEVREKSRAWLRHDNSSMPLTGAMHRFMRR